MSLSFSSWIPDARIITCTWLVLLALRGPVCVKAGFSPNLNADSPPMIRQYRLCLENQLPTAVELCPDFDFISDEQAAPVRPLYVRAQLGTIDSEYHPQRGVRCHKVAMTTWKWKYEKLQPLWILGPKHKLGVSPTEGVGLTY